MAGEGGPALLPRGLAVVPAAGGAHQLHVRVDGRQLLGHELFERLALGTYDEGVLQQACVVLVEVVDVACAVPGEEVVRVQRGPRLEGREGLAREEQLEGAAVEAGGQGVSSFLLLELAHLDHQAHVARAGDEHALVEREGLLPEARALEQARRLTLEARVVRQVVGQGKGLRRAGRVVVRQEGLAEVEVDLGRHHLRQADQAPAVGQVLLRLPLTRAAEGAGAAPLGDVHQLPQHRGPPLAGDGERVLQGDQHPVRALDLLRQVGQELVEVHLVVAARQALEGDAPRPLEHGLGRLEVEQAVDGDGEQVVLLRGLRQVLEDADGPGALAQVAHQVRHQQVALDASRVLGDAAPVGLDGLFAQAGEGQHAGLELEALGAHLELLEPRQHPPRLVRLAPLELAHGQLPQVVPLALGVHLDQLPHDLLVVEVVVAGEVDPRLLLQGVDDRATGLLEELVDHLGGGDRVADLGVEAHEQAGLPVVGAALDQLALQLDGDVGQGAEARGDRHQAVLGVAAPGDGVDAPPEGEPALEGHLLLADLRVEPGQPHLQVLAGAVRGARRAHALEHLDGALLAVELLPGVRELVALGRLRGRHLAHAQEAGLGLVEAAAVLVQAEEEEQRGVGQLTGGDAALGGLHRQLVEAQVHHRLGAPQALVEALRGVDEAAPDRLPGGAVAALEVGPGEALAPLDDGGLLGDQVPVDREHDLLVPRLAVHLEQLAAHLHVELTVARVAEERDRLVVALALAQQADPGPLQDRIELGLGLELVDQGVEGVVQAVGLDQDRQAVVAVALELGGEDRAPGVLLGLLRVLGGDGPLGHAHLLAEALLARLVDLVELDRVLGPLAQAEHDRGPVAQGGLAPLLLREVGQGLLVLVLLFRHPQEGQAQAHADLELLLLGHLEQSLPGRDRVLDPSEGVEQLGPLAQELGVRGLVLLATERVVHPEGLLQVPAPAQQPAVQVGHADIVGRGLRAPRQLIHQEIDGAVVEHGLGVQALGLVGGLGVQGQLQGAKRLRAQGDGRGDVRFLLGRPGGESRDRDQEEEGEGSALHHEVVARPWGRRR